MSCLSQLKGNAQWVLYQEVWHYREAAAPTLFLCDFVPKSVPEWKEKEVESYNFVLKTPASDEAHLLGQMIQFL